MQWGKTSEVMTRPSGPDAVYILHVRGTSRIINHPAEPEPTTSDMYTFCDAKRLFPTDIYS
jgi:hypothetical protein